MKLFVVVLGLLLADSRHADAAECACATGNLHVRSGAGTSHGILHTMAPGDCLPYHGDSTHVGTMVWYHLDFHGKSGWAASGWLTLKACGSSSHGGTQLAGCPHIVSRAEWGARAPKHAPGNMGALPIYVFIHHGTGPGCHDKASCIQKVKGYQNYHMDGHDGGFVCGNARWQCLKRFGGRGGSNCTWSICGSDAIGWSDIGYNFVVGEDGNAYEARGWKEIGAHTKGYNSNGIAICVIGDFTSHVPNAAALNTVKQLIECGLKNHHISPSYTLKGHRDVGATACPGTAFYNLIHSWSHYASGTKHFG